MANKTLLSFGRNSGAKVSQCWVLQALAGVIATAGVVSDSTATVIGAMIVAPMMTPTLGSAFAIVLAERYRAMRSLVTVLGGAAFVIAIGVGFGILAPLDVTLGDSPVASRVAHHLIDLIAALVTGLVGAFALVRPHNSDTLPGVAIAISLVPPLAVVGLTLEKGAHERRSRGPAAVRHRRHGHHLHRDPRPAPLPRPGRRRRVRLPRGALTGSTLSIIVGAVLAVAVPLGYGSHQVLRDSLTSTDVLPVARQWARANGWEVVDLQVDSRGVHVTALGLPSGVRPEALRAALDNSGLADLDLSVELVVGGV